MKIFGIGFHRTGTTTLSACLQKLGYNVCGFRPELLKNYCCGGDLKKVLETIKDYDAFQDFPWPLMYEEFDFYYENTKFILTTRKNAEVWWKSLARHYTGINNTELTKIVYNHERFIGNKKYFKFKYKRHNQKVRDYFEKRNDFIELSWETGDSWEELCSFLGKKKPSVPFPHKNKS